MSLRQLLERQERRTKTISLGPEFDNQTVTVQSMTVSEKGRFEAQFRDKKTGNPKSDRVAEVRQRIVIECCVDENGKKIFTLEDMEMMSKADAGLIEAIVNAAAELNQISTEDVEELAGN